MNLVHLDRVPALSGIPLDELPDYIGSCETSSSADAPLPRFRAIQIFRWIANGVSLFDGMSNIPLSLRKELAKRFSVRPKITVQQHNGNDGTVKLTLQLADGAWIESVLLTGGTGRHTACLSTQAGCPAGCVFCKTGTGFARNLDSSEIVEQFLRLRSIAPIDNIVVMGMGEPLLNVTGLRRALAVIGNKEGLRFSMRRVTVSTCGIAGGIIELAEKGPAVRLALSLTTGDEYLRRRLMPISVNQPLNKVKEALVYFQSRGGGRITLEAVLLGGVNTRKDDADGIAVFARGLDAVVNVIPWNPVKGLIFDGKPLQEPSAGEVAAYILRLESLGLKVTRRYRRGRGITGACGQLGNR